MAAWAQILFEQLVYWFEHSSTLIQFLFTNYAFLGPILGIGLPFIESFLPFLPLMGMTVLNVVVFGPVIGFLYTWIGTTLGSYVVFLAIRYLIHDWVWNFIEQRMPKQTEGMRRLLQKIERRGLIVIFILYGPMTLIVSSALLNVTAGLANISKKTFFIGLLGGKFIAIAFSTLIGRGVTKIFDNPLFLIGSLIGMFGLYVVARFIEKQYFIDDDKLVNDN
ncbi:MAG: TVP38/TMEM64 family protein [Culicoidibacterales bacterium]